MSDGSGRLAPRYAPPCWRCCSSVAFEALTETGQADLIEFVLGALTGGAVLWVSHRLLRGLVGTLRACRLRGSPSRSPC